MGRRLKVLFFPSRYPSPTQPYLAMFHREHLRAVSLYHDVVVLDAPREESSTTHVAAPYLRSWAEGWASR